MPVSNFISSIADKAQSAINNTPLAQHIQVPHQTSTTGGSSHTSTPGPHDPTRAGGQTAAQNAQQHNKSHTLEALQYQLRAFGQQYINTNVTPVQKIITVEKGVAIDFDGVARDAKAQSKELYTWGQGETEDLKDVTDRLAYLNFVQGSLASSLAVKLDAARGALKAYRDAENALIPRHSMRANLHAQIVRLEHEQVKGTEARLAEFRDRLRKAELDDQPLEKEVELLKRKAIRDSEQQKWDAIREYGEKLVLLSQASTPIIKALPSIPPSASNPYAGAQATGAARASLQRALDDYKTGHINLPPQSPTQEVSSDTRSFGESHASELESIYSSEGGVAPQGTALPITPPATDNVHPVAQPSAVPAGASTSSNPFTDPAPASASSTSVRSTVRSPPIDPNALNHSPTPLPAPSATVPTSSPLPGIVPDPENPTVKLPVATPTVAETGVPVSAGVDGPGPASGSLRNVRAASASAGPRSGGLPGNVPQEGYGQRSPVAEKGAGEGLAGSVGSTGGAAGGQYESAEEEKRRLQRGEAAEVSGGVGTPSAGTGAGYETAADEKKRLEREERERILAGGGSDPSGGDDELPPYQAL